MPNPNEDKVQLNNRQIEDSLKNLKLFLEKTFD